MLRSIAFVLMTAFATIHAASQDPGRGLIFQPGEVPFASSHASTVVELKDGSLMAAWFGGTEEGHPDTAIWSSRRSAESHTWSRPKELARETAVPCWNPVLFHSSDGRLWLYYKFGPSPSTWTAARKHSDDEGKTWSAAEHLPAGLVGPVRAKPLVLADGTIVSGSSTESYQSWAVWIERSIDDGNTWTRIGPIVSPTGAFTATANDHSAADGASPIPASQKPDQTTGIIQPSVVSLGGEHLRFYARSTANIARITVADSFDNGKTWARTRLLHLPNPNSGIDAVALKDGRVVLVFNNTTEGRTPLNLAVSRDGEHFKVFSTLEDRPGEYSYPSMIEGKNGDLYITYTWNRKSIAFRHLPLSEIPK